MGKKKDARRAKLAAELAAELVERADAADQSRRDMAAERGQALQRVGEIRKALEAARGGLQPLRALIKAGRLDEADAAIVKIDAILGDPARAAAGQPMREQPNDPATPFFPADVILVDGKPFRLTPLEADKKGGRK